MRFELSFAVLFLYTNLTYGKNVHSLHHAYFQELSIFTKKFVGIQYN